MSEPKLYRYYLPSENGEGWAEIVVCSTGVFVEASGLLFVIGDDVCLEDTSLRALDRAGREAARTLVSSRADWPHITIADCAAWAEAIVVACEAMGWTGLGMSDLVVTVPKNLWRMWIEEGDLPGQPATDEWAFYTSGGRPPIKPGERVYVVAHGRLRGYAPLVRVAKTERGWALVRANDAVAVTIPTPIPGFRGWRKAWWDRRIEVPFPDWQTAGLPEPRQRELAL